MLDARCSQEESVVRIDSPAPTSDNWHLRRDEAERKKGQEELALALDRSNRESL